MSRTTLIVWGMGAMSVAVAAQRQPEAPSPRPLTLTGCVRAWDASSMGTPPAASPGSAPLLLTGAERQAPAAAPAPASPSTPAPADAPGLGAHSTYLLRAAADSVRLSEYVDRKVEVTGALVADAAAATPAATPKPTPAPSTATAREGAAPPSPPVVFTVNAIRALETTCPTR
jgi:hypothetical protein